MHDCLCLDVCVCGWASRRASNALVKNEWRLVSFRNREVFSKETALGLVDEREREESSSRADRKGPWKELLEQKAGDGSLERARGRKPKKYLLDVSAPMHRMRPAAEAPLRPSLSANISRSSPSYLLNRVLADVVQEDADGGECQRDLQLVVKL